MAIAVPIAATYHRGASNRVVTEIGPAGQGGPPPPNPTPQSSPTCYATPGERCTRYGPLGPWQSATLGADQRNLTVVFAGICAGDDYEVGIRRTPQDVVIAVYGERPYSNPSAGARSVLSLINVGTACAAYGYPSVDFFDRSGAALDVPVAHGGTSGFVTTPNELPLEVVLRPSQAVNFVVDLRAGDTGTCESVTAVGLKGTNRTIQLSAEGAGVRACGAVHESPLYPPAY